VASGFTGAALLRDADKRHEKAQLFNWQHEPDLCHRCLGQPEADPVKAYGDVLRATPLLKRC
jgi:hypothetical protein